MVVLWVSVPLTLWAGSLLPLDSSDSLLIFGLLGLYVTIATVLTWLWNSFVPTRTNRKKRTALIDWLVSIFAFFSALYVSAILALLEMKHLFAMVSGSWRVSVTLLLILIQWCILMLIWRRLKSIRRGKEPKLDEH